jgi:hypothetical protein
MRLMECSGPKIRLSVMQLPHTTTVHRYTHRSPAYCPSQIPAFSAGIFSTDQHNLRAEMGCFCANGERSDTPENNLRYPRLSAWGHLI